MYEKVPFFIKIDWADEKFQDFSTKFGQITYNIRGNMNPVEELNRKKLANPLPP